MWVTTFIRDRAQCLPQRLYWEPASATLSWLRTTQDTRRRWTKTIVWYCESPSLPIENEKGRFMYMQSKGVVGVKNGIVLPAVYELVVGKELGREERPITAQEFTVKQSKDWWIWKTSPPLVLFEQNYNYNINGFFTCINPSNGAVEKVFLWVYEHITSMSCTIHDWQDIQMKIVFMTILGDTTICLTLWMRRIEPCILQQGTWNNPANTLQRLLQPFPASNVSEIVSIDILGMQISKTVKGS